MKKLFRKLFRRNQVILAPAMQHIRAGQLVMIVNGKAYAIEPRSLVRKP